MYRVSHDPTGILVSMRRRREVQEPHERGLRGIHALDDLKRIGDRRAAPQTPSPSAAPSTRPFKDGCSSRGASAGAAVRPPIPPNQKLKRARVRIASRWGCQRAADIQALDVRARRLGR
jgi:hypothetical protein